MNPNAPLSGCEFTSSDTVWRYYKHQATPIKSNHAQEFSRDAATAFQESSRETVDAGDNEYNPTTVSTARNLCLETKQGTLVDFLDEFGENMKSHTVQRNLVSTEMRTKRNYDWVP